LVFHSLCFHFYGNNLAVEYKVIFLGWEGSIGGKLAVKTLTSKGTSKELFNIPNDYKGYVVQNIKRTSQDPIYGPLADFTSVRYFDYGSPEGVLRLAYGWTKEEIASSLKKDGMITLGTTIIGREVDINSEYVDSAFGYKKYNSTEEYLASV
jgi:hypothetical protein